MLSVFSGLSPSAKINLKSNFAVLRGQTWVVWWQHTAPFVNLRLGHVELCPRTLIGWFSTYPLRLFRQSNTLTFTPIKNRIYTVWETFFWVSLKTMAISDVVNSFLQGFQTSIFLTLNTFLFIIPTFVCTICRYSCSVGYLLFWTFCPIICFTFSLLSKHFLFSRWISGVCSVHHPYVWACCLRYLNCSEIKDR